MHLNVFKIIMTFNALSDKIQDELVDIITNDVDVNEYQLIMYKYIFITELKIPVHEELGIEILENSFVLYIIPDDLDFELLERLVNAFDKFKVRFRANGYNIIKLEFELYV